MTREILPVIFKIVNSKESGPNFHCTIFRFSSLEQRRCFQSKPLIYINDLMRMKNPWDNIVELIVS